MKKWQKSNKRWSHILRLLSDLDRSGGTSDLRVFTTQAARAEFGNDWHAVLKELSRVEFSDERHGTHRIVKDLFWAGSIVCVLVAPRECLSPIASIDGFQRHLRIIDADPVAA